MSFSNKMFISIYWNIEQFIINMCFIATIQYGDYNPKWPTRNVLRFIFQPLFHRYWIFSVFFYSSKDKESKSDIFYKYGIQVGGSNLRWMPKKV